jgi:hypothetical protein
MKAQSQSLCLEKERKPRWATRDRKMKLTSSLPVCLKINHAWHWQQQDNLVGNEIEDGNDGVEKDVVDVAAMRRWLPVP